MGLAAWAPHETAAEAIGRADRALYAAKDAGRDRIFIARPAPRPAGSGTRKDPLPTLADGDGMPAAGDSQPLAT
jgi:hypothetical protein